MKMSIVVRLQLTIFLLAVAVLGPLGIATARLTLIYVNELCDARLVRAAHAMDQLVGLVPPASAAQGSLPNVPVLPPMGATPTFEVEVGYRVIRADGSNELVTENLRRLDVRSIPDQGFGEVRLDGRRWRLYRLNDASRALAIIVGERHDSRRDILRAVWMEHTLPLVLGLPLLGWAIIWMIEHILSPLSEFARTLSLRRKGAREPIHVAGMTGELATLVDSVNHYLARVEHAYDRESRFSADVAHELRTPIASAMITIEDALLSPQGKRIHATLPDALTSLRRLRERSEELLALARLDEMDFKPSHRVDLRHLIDRVVGDTAAEAEDANVSVVWNRPPHVVRIAGDEVALYAMLRNLLANAFRHTPLRGHVVILLESRTHGCVLIVADDGPGIPPARREAVFQRFHRETGLGDGMGVGLSIVQRVVKLHGASVVLDDGIDGRGLQVRIRFPRKTS